MTTGSEFNDYVVCALIAATIVIVWLLNKLSED